MQRIALIFVLALLALSCGTDELTPTGTEFNVAAGDTFTIRVESNPSTGYAWKLASTPPDDIIVVTDGRFEQSSGSGDGVGGVQIFVFEAVGPGSTVVELAEVDDADVESRSRSHAVTVSE